MAIDDIVRKIAEDAENEAASIIAEAETDAASVRADATSTARAKAAHVLASESARAARDAETIVANARLAARDAMLSARMALDLEVLSRAERALVDLPDADYAALIARAVTGTARGGERLLLGTADAGRLRTRLAKALSDAGVPALAGEGEAPIERGVVLEGDRVRVEVSPSAMIAERSAELLALADAELFGAEA